MMKVWFGVVLALAVGAVFSGCGKCMSDAERKDAAQVLKVLQRDTGGGMAMQLQPLKDKVQGAAWLTAFSRGGHSDTSMMNACGSGEAGCTFSCLETGVMNFDCSPPDETQKSCNGVTYKFTSAKYSGVLDFSALNSMGNGGTPTGTLRVMMNVGANVLGGSLDGKRLECGFDFKIDLSNPDAGSVGDDFECSYDGKDVDAEDLMKEMNAIPSCSA